MTTPSLELPQSCYSARMTDREQLEAGYLRAWKLYASGELTHVQVAERLRDEGWTGFTGDRTATDWIQRGARLATERGIEAPLIPDADERRQIERLTSERSGRRRIAERDALIVALRRRYVRTALSEAKLAELFGVSRATITRACQQERAGAGA